MRYLFWLVLPVLFPLPAFSQPPDHPHSKIGIYADEIGLECGLRDTPGPRTVYVIQKFNAGVVSSRFRVEESAGMSGTLLSFSSPFTIASGDPISGIAVEYGECLPGDVYVLALNMMFYGTSSECSWMRIAGHPLSPDGRPETLRCDLERRPTDWGGIHIDIQMPFFCPEEPAHSRTCKPIYEPPLPVQSSTWGAVKALYKN